MSAQNVEGVFSHEMLKDLIKAVDFKPNPLLYSAVPLGSLRVFEGGFVPPGQVYVVDENIIKPSMRMSYTNQIDVLDTLDAKDSLGLQKMATEIKKRIFDENTLFSLVNGINEDPKQRAALQTPPPNACDACRGSGVFNGEECWHCDGEGDDPTK